MKLQTKLLGAASLVVSIIVTACLYFKLVPTFQSKGLVVLAVDRLGTGGKAGVQVGDVLIDWFYQHKKGIFDSPFTLIATATNYGGKGTVYVEGVRPGSGSKLWSISAGNWGLRTEPNSSDRHYLSGPFSAAFTNSKWWLAKSIGALPGEKHTSPAVWLIFQQAERSSKDGNGDTADRLYNSAIDRVQGEPDIRAQLFRAWGTSLFHRGSRIRAEEKYRQALIETKSNEVEGAIASAIYKEMGDNALASGDLVRGEQDYLRALEIAEASSGKSLAAENSLIALGNVRRLHGDYQIADKYFRRALELSERIEPGSLDVAVALTSIGTIARDQGDLTRSEAYSGRALQICRKVAPKSLALASALTNLGHVALLRSDLDIAESRYLEARVVLDEIAPHSSHIASVLRDLGTVDSQRADFNEAINFLQQALSIEESVAPASYGIATTLFDLASALEQRKELRLAEQYFSRSLTLSKKFSRLDVAECLMGLGDVQLHRGSLKRASKLFQESLAITNIASAPGTLTAAIYLKLGTVADHLGQSRIAADDYFRCLKFLDQLGPTHIGHAQVYAVIANLRRRQKKISEAAAFYEKALSSLDIETARIGGTEQSSSFFRADHDSIYKSYVDLLVQQRKISKAFNVLEQSHARALLVSLSSAHINGGGAVRTMLSDRQRTLGDAIDFKSAQRVQLLEDRHTDVQLSILDQELSKLIREHREVTEGLKAANPSYSALANSSVLTVGAVRRNLLDSDTVLLEYTLGTPSYVFAITQQSSRIFKIANKGEIESAVRKTYNLLTEANHFVKGESNEQKQRRLEISDKQYRKQSTALSDLILKPIAGEIAHRRLAIVADGALHYVPFPALPEPFRGTPLILEHEIVNLPSASVLSVLRREELARHSPLKAVAVLADPVFESSDPRVNQAGKSNRLQGSTSYEAILDLSRLRRSMNDLGPEGNSPLHLAALPSSRAEANAIMAAVPLPNQATEYLDFRASRATAMDPTLAEYRIVHFATHALFNNKHPELSGLIFSLVDSKGKPLNGFLNLQDIYRMHLPVDLVVLSACETALGTEIEGEGLMGITRAFIYAGARRVLNTLWKIDDLGTSELMKRLYTGMEAGSMTPSAALRKAQLEMLHSETWSSPFYWAAFSLEGDWQNTSFQAD